jgi:alpha-tubulin suppressor-like RCC1 family protein
MFMIAVSPFALMYGRREGVGCGGEKRTQQKTFCGRMRAVRGAVVLLALASGCFQQVNEACFVYVVTSDSHSCARKTDGTLWCWGNNQYGQLGTGDTNPRAIPTQVEGLTGVTGVYLPTAIGVVSSRTASTCARRNDSTLWCWGNNDSGQLGTNDTMLRIRPVQVDPDGLGASFHNMQAGAAFGCLRKTDNTLWCWGNNESGQLGLGDHDRRLVPKQVAPDTLPAIAQVYSGENHACAVSADGTLWCWGDNRYGQLGTGDQQPRLVPVPIDPMGLGSGVTSVFAGDNHTCAVRSDGTLWCWGDNRYGQLGTRDTMNRLKPTQIDFELIGSGVSVVTAGGQHTCAGRTDGTLWCWGRNSDGELGTGVPDNSPMPVPVDSRQMNVTVVEVYAGGTHTCARTADSALWCWGGNAFAQLGLPGVSGETMPTLVAPACP